MRLHFNFIILILNTFIFCETNAQNLQLAIKKEIETVHIKQQSIGVSVSIMRNGWLIYSEQLDALYKVPTAEDYSYTMGGGYIVSATDDLVKFGRAFLQPGIFSENEIKLTTFPVQIENVQPFFSYGWLIWRSDNGEPVFYITGGGKGCQGSLYVYPKEKMVIAILANSFGKGSVSNKMIIDLKNRLIEICQKNEK
jgi:CubicO group peptidase (beta-lactamase class C family)